MRIKRCNKCGRTNPVESLYCKQCGASLPRVETLPRGLKLEQDSWHLAATYPWFSTGRLIRMISATLVCLFFSLVFMSFIVSDAKSERLFSFMNLLISIIALGALIFGVYCAYQMIRIGLNTTTPYFSRSELRITHRPLPANGNHLIKPCDITELSIEERKESWLPLLVFEDWLKEWLEDWVLDKIFYTHLYQIRAKFRNGNCFVILEGPDSDTIARLKLGMENFIADQS